MNKILNKKIIWIIVGIIAIFIFIFTFIMMSYCHWCATPNKDSRIIAPIIQSRRIISFIYKNKNNYDSFNCDHPDMIMLCQEIDENYGPEDGKEPTITHETLNNSQEACIYSPLNKKKETSWWLFKKKEKIWYCADSSERAGYTTINPGNPGYCVEGESAVCPPLEEIG